MRVIVLSVLLVGCRTEYTRCAACFVDDPNGYCWDGKVMEPLGSKDPKDAKCSASLGLCDGVESRALQGVPHPAHQAVCKDKPSPFACSPEWTAKFTYQCESQKVGVMVPF